MIDENSYLRTKEKYIVEITWNRVDRLQEMFDSFGPGTYWHLMEDRPTDEFALYEVWLAPEEITALKIVLPNLWYLKIR